VTSPRRPVAAQPPDGWALPIRDATRAPCAPRPGPAGRPTDDLAVQPRAPRSGSATEERQEPEDGDPRHDRDDDQ